ncbi:MAG: response regulator transcription factor [Chloroflexi bacterium]|uniref:response regulator transcription factor n=1 Tax=Candidatus Flexifilum breve TaxID=3140694 RepID=UPI003135A070|nr:response regulator transcription factor [Chloroflexota bacterium]
MAHKILVADDEAAILDTVRAYLIEAGMQVVTAKNGREAVYAFRHEQPALVILDVMMPEMDGWEAARLIRKESQIPLLFLTARVDDIEHVTGLEIGADEYITKPFSPRVLVAHVRALLRRVYGDLGTVAPVWRAGNLEVNSETHTVTRAGERIELTPTEFELLAALIARPGRVFTRAELLDRLQGQSFAAFERAIDVHVKNLRAKIEPDPRDPQYIETVFGVGYRMREA